jgi:RNA recognition motif-containing protein
MSDPVRLAATVYVSNLDPRVNPGNLHSAFIPFGDIADINLPKPDLAPGIAPPPPGTPIQGHRGYGYVEFESEEDAKEAIDNMDRSELFGRVIRVAKAKPQSAVGEGLGSKVALWEQVCLPLSKSSRANSTQDGYLAGLAEANASPGGPPVVAIGDPMTGLEELDVAGPKEN